MLLFVQIQPFHSIFTIFFHNETAFTSFYAQRETATKLLHKQNLQLWEKN